MSEAVARRRSGGRAARRGGGDAPAAAAILKREIAPYDLLREEELARIEGTSETLLQEIGMEIREDPESLALWTQAGAEVKGERVRFPKGLVKKIILDSAPKSFTQHARNPERSVIIGGDHVVFSPSYGSPFVRDLEGGRRYGTLEDFRNFVKLAYASPWLNHSGGTVCEPVDVPVSKRHLDMVEAHLRFSDKPFMGSVTAGERAEDSIEMARIVFGRDFVEKNCVILGNVNVNSPLVYDATMTAALKAYARANQCAVVVPFILGGAMGPVTTAGAIAQSMAEAMVGVALTQLVRPGAPVILGNFLSSMSLRSGAPTFGMPEPSLGYYVVGQLTRRLGIPLRCGGAITSAKTADAQAAQESVDSLNATLLAGANFILHAAGWLEGGLTIGYEKFMIDADRLGMAQVFLKGLPVDDNSLALEAFREVGIGKHFLGCAHTMANYKTAFYNPELSDSDSFEQWRDAGEQDIQQRALGRWKKVLADYEAPPMEEGVSEALAAFVERRKRELPDAWY
jgi:trimethylamine--corrinoid protein Co-methyltransferase